MYSKSAADRRLMAASHLQDHNNTPIIPNGTIPAFLTSLPIGTAIAATTHSMPATLIVAVPFGVTAGVLWRKISRKKISLTSTAGNAFAAAAWGALLAIPTGIVSNGLSSINRDYNQATNYIAFDTHQEFDAAPSLTP